MISQTISEKNITTQTNAHWYVINCGIFHGLKCLERSSRSACYIWVKTKSP